MSTEQKAYCYFLVPRWDFSGRLLADLLAFALLVRLARLPSFAACACANLRFQAELVVAWCTHKYKQTEDGERQQAKGSGNRTHFYLVARDARDSGRGVRIMDAYHTAMWFHGTAPSR